MLSALPEPTLSLRHAPACTLFIVWVSVCAFAPEVIWQGGTLLSHEFGSAEIYNAVFIAILFTFFVEPIAERLKAGAMWLPHGHVGSRFVLGAAVSLMIGAAVVCVHESMGAYLGVAHAEEPAKWIRLNHAITQALEWASVPAAAAVAWFTALASRRIGYWATGIACIWIVTAGLIWGWSLQDELATSLIGCVVTVWGTRIVLRGWTPRTVQNLARSIAITAAASLTFAATVPILLGWLTGSAYEFYTLAEAYEDFRFYVGWILGLLFAPDPVPDPVPVPVPVQSPTHAPAMP